MLHVLLMSRVLFVCRMSYVCMCTPHTPNTRAGSLTMGPWSVIVSRHIHTQLARAANRSIYLYITHIYRIWLKRSVHATFIVLCFVALWMWFSVFSLPFFPYSLCFFLVFLRFLLLVLSLCCICSYTNCLMLLSFWWSFPSSLTTHQRSTGNVFSASFSAKRSHVYHGYL